MKKIKKIFKPMATGWKPDPIDGRDASWDKILGAIAEAPPPVFTRPVPEYIPFQDNINCCVWGTAAADQEFSSRQEGNNPKLSFRYGYAKTPGGTGGRGYRESAQWLKDYGIPEEQYCANDWTVGANEFLNVAFVGLAGIENANRYRIKNYSFLTDLSLNNLKAACFRKPVWIAIPGNNKDWSKDKNEIIVYSGTADWYHSVLLWDWTENYLGILNWWGDGYRKLSLTYPMAAALSTEDLPDNWKQKNMDYVNIGKEQFLIFEPWKIAFNLGDEIELARIAHRLPATPRPIANLDGYFIYPMLEKSRWVDLLGL